MNPTEPVAPYPDAVEAAAVRRIRVSTAVVGLSHATALAVQAGADTAVIYGSLDGTAWHPVVHLEPEELADLPFLDAIRAEPEGVVVTLLARFPLR